MFYCKDCGHTTHGKRALRGSGLFDFLLWLPALIVFCATLFDFLHGLSVMRDLPPGVSGGISDIDLGSAGLLFLLLSAPAMAYSCWRLGTAHRACTKCGSGNLIPSDSPIAQELQRAHSEG